MSWDPTAVHDDSRSINFNWVFLRKSILERKSATFITIKWVNYIKAINFLTIDGFLTRNQYFLTHVELSEKEIGLEAVVDCPLFFWHAPPGEVHLFPWCAIRDALTKSVVALTSVESLLNVFSVLEVSYCSSENACVYCAVTEECSFLSWEAFDQTS